MSTYRVFPHCDMHLALNNPNANSISFRVVSYFNLTSPFTLSDVTATLTPRVFAPHNPVGNRLQSFVNINVGAGTITATGVGTNLVIFEGPDTYMVVRIQVHDNILAWWFGNEKITTALDNQRGHAQPSIYAMFSDDPTGTDRVGDITGHGLVNLASSNNAVFTIDNNNSNQGRLRGLSEGAATLTGNFLGISHDLPVQVVNYAKQRDILAPIRAGDLVQAADRHNILFLAEGFTAGDEEKFNGIVTQVADELFTKPRHEPYGTLSGSFNVFKAFTPSNDRLITCGFQVTDNQVPALDKGKPIPYEHSVSAEKYEVAELVVRVGLPMRGESRNTAQLKALWNSQSLHDFNDAKVDDTLVDAWKNSHSLGILEARDTFFGMIAGLRWADNFSRLGGPLTTMPANDDGSNDLKALVRRAYEFYQQRVVARSIDMDPRRYPPELFLSNNENRVSSFMDFLSGLRVTDPPHQALGSEWVPDGSFKRSRGLIAMIINEHMNGGTNLGNHTVTANCIQDDLALTANYVADANANIKRLRRDVPQPNDFEPELTSVINTVAHEFGHSFNLGDEYEEFVETPTFANDQLNPGDTRSNTFEGFDNITSLETVFDDANYLASGSRKVDPAKLKWRVLPRIKLSARLTAASQINAGKLEVTIDRREADPWEQARVAGDEVHLRRILIEPNGKQLPLSTADADHLIGLTIDSVDAGNGKIVLSSGTPLAPPPAFPAGSSLFIPHRLSGGGVKTLIEEKVFAALNGNKEPLNKDPDTATVNRSADYPRDIADFKPPCQSARLIGVFEGAGRWTGLVYRPAGTCKMRTSKGEDEHGQFCQVCKWLITNRVDPGKHHEIDSKFYPKAKKNE